ncbi:hypothetical protein QTN47_17675 [Danxiaibacter flavus]|uniref:DUF3592 domain-containing protein n=1 Tax=Danxiaibacter flavus TaxID=3049108 RepID=A0ABV3ZLB5_9BACT|nr:hypothetical protein QNM32_17685 [Chitinophagaceae bacterium DXS]
MESSGKKEIIIFTIAAIVLMILLHGNELDDFQNSNDTDAFLLPILYFCSAVPVFIFIGKRIKNLTVKDKVFMTIILMMITLLPMYLLSGLIKYVDYYTTNKQWKLIKASIVNKSSTGGGRSHTVYTYTIKSGDSLITLYSPLSYPVGQNLHLKICKTNLGITVANNYRKM